MKSFATQELVLLLGAFALVPMLRRCTIFACRPVLPSLLALAPRIATCLATKGQQDFMVFVRIALISCCPILCSVIALFDFLLRNSALNQFAYLILRIAITVRRHDLELRFLSRRVYALAFR